MATISRDQWEAELRAFKCRIAGTKNSSIDRPGQIAPEWWTTDWGHSFPVPVITPEGDVDAQAFSILLQNLLHMRSVRSLGRF
jgi:hypothetical protein